jgi:outer membrane receptor for ferrienterochelin and colicins
MKKTCILVVLLISISIVNAQYIFKATITGKDKSPLAASVSLKESNRLLLADSLGFILITNIPAGKQTFTFNHIGYRKKEITFSFPLVSNSPIEIVLENDFEQIDEVVVQTTRSNRKLQDIPTRIEAVSPDELDEKGTMKPGDIRMLLNESTGITTQQTSAVSGTANIRIQGLDGRYTQILKDGMPLYTGFSGGLSILQIAPLDLKQVEYIKGSASTLYGGGAISGLVNLITKTPTDKRELNFLLNGNSGHGFDGNGFYAQKWKKVGLTIFSSYNYNGAYDPAGIGLTAIPKTNRFTFNPKLFLYFNKNTNGWIGINTTFEDRFGGDLQVIRGNSDATHQFFERNKTTRISTQSSLTHIINEFSSFNIKNSIGIFERDLSLPASRFQGRQISTFSELNYVHKKRNSEWIAGINEWTEHFIPQSTTQLHYDLTTIGAFGQYTYKANKWFSLESGLRIDKNQPAAQEKTNGIYVLPRVNLLFRIDSFLTSRIGGGLGYKMPGPFLDDAEKNAYQNIQSIDFSGIRSEKSFGINADISYQKQIDETKINLNQFFFYTKLDDPLLLQGNRYLNANGYIDTKGAETNMKISIDELSLYLGYTYTDTRQHYNGGNTWQPLSAKHRVNADITYEIENSFRFGVESFYTGEQALSDGTKGTAFIIFGLLVQKMWKHFDLFINAENLTDRRQSKWGPVFTGSISSPVFKEIYAPLDGVIVNSGIKIKF